MTNGTVCPHCGATNYTQSTTCKRCQGNLFALIPAPSSEPISIEAREEALEAEINMRVGNGWIVVDRTATTAHLKLRKKPNDWLVLLLLSLGLIPYMIYTSVFNRPEDMSIEIDEFGSINRHVVRQ